MDKPHLVCAASGMGYAILVCACMVLVPGALEKNGAVIIAIGLVAAVVATAGIFTLAVLRGTPEGMAHSSIGTGTRFLRRLGIAIMMTMATYAATLAFAGLLVAAAVMVLLKPR